MRWLLVKPEAGEVHQLQEKRCRAQLREPSAQPDPRLLLGMSPNHAQPWLLRNARKK